MAAKTHGGANDVGGAIGDTSRMPYFDGESWSEYNEDAGQFPRRGIASVSLRRYTLLLGRAERAKKANALRIDTLRWQRDHCLRVCLALEVASRALRAALGSPPLEVVAAEIRRVEGPELDELRKRVAVSDAVRLPEPVSARPQQPPTDE